MTGATLKASARDGIYIHETSGDMNVQTIYSESHVHLVAEDGSILDGVGSDFANIAALGINLEASGDIGSSDNYLDLDLTGTSVLNALAQGDIFLRETARIVVRQQGRVFRRGRLSEVSECHLRRPVRRL